MRCTVIRSLEQLFALGALDTDSHLTAVGKQMADFPLDPIYAKMLIVSQVGDFALLADR